MYNSTTFLGAWSSTTQYGKIPYNGTSGIIGLQPIVSYNNLLYINNNALLPTKGTTPDLDAAWSVFATVNVIPTTLSYANISNIVANTAISNGVISLDGVTKESSADITISSTSAINLPNKICQIQGMFKISTDTTGTAYFNYVGTNCRVSSNLMQPITNSIYQTCYLNSIITPTGANPSIKIVASAVSGAVTLPQSASISILSIN